MSDTIPPSPRTSPPSTTSGAPGSRERHAQLLKRIVWAGEVGVIALAAILLLAQVVIPRIEQGAPGGELPDLAWVASIVAVVVLLIDYFLIIRPVRAFRPRALWWMVVRMAASVGWVWFLWGDPQPGDFYYAVWAGLTVALAVTYALALQWHGVSRTSPLA